MRKHRFALRIWFKAFGVETLITLTFETGSRRRGVPFPAAYPPKIIQTGTLFNALVGMSVIE